MDNKFSEEYAASIFMVDVSSVVGGHKNVEGTCSVRLRGQRLVGIRVQDYAVK